MSSAPELADNRQLFLEQKFVPVMFHWFNLQSKRSHLQEFQHITCSGVAGSSQSGPHPVNFQHVKYGRNVAASAASAAL